MTTDGRPVRSRHGLAFAPRADLASAAAGLERLLVPGADAARRKAADGLAVPKGPTPAYLHQRPGFAFDAARTRDVATARWVAKTLECPTTSPPLSGPAWPWTLTLRPILIAAATVAAVLGVRFLGRRRRGALRGGDPTAPPAQPADTASNVQPSFQLTRRRP